MSSPSGLSRGWRSLSIEDDGLGSWAGVDGKGAGFVDTGVAIEKLRYLVVDIRLEIQGKRCAISYFTVSTRDQED